MGRLHPKNEAGMTRGFVCIEGAGLGDNQNFRNQEEM